MEDNTKVVGLSRGIIPEGEGSVRLTSLHQPIKYLYFELLKRFKLSIKMGQFSGDVNCTSIPLQLVFPGHSIFSLLILVDESPGHG